MPVSLGIIASSISGRLWEPQGAYDALSTVTVPSGGLASITFAGIPQGYKHLQIRQIARTTVGVTITSGNGIRFNSDAGANYAVHQIIGDGASVTAGAFTSSDYIYYSANTGSTAGANIFGTAIIDVLDYTANKNKTVRVLAGADLNGTGSVYFRSGLWMSTSAISSITIDARDSSSFVQNSQFTLYGVR